MGSCPLTIIVLLEHRLVWMQIWYCLALMVWCAAMGPGGRCAWMVVFLILCNQTLSNYQQTINLSTYYTALQETGAFSSTLHHFSHGIAKEDDRLLLEPAENVTIALDTQVKGLHIDSHWNLGDLPFWSQSFSTRWFILNIQINIWA
jgi:hypothetical protein